MILIFNMEENLSHSVKSNCQGRCHSRRFWGTL